MLLGPNYLGQASTTKFHYYMRLVWSRRTKREVELRVQILDLAR